MASTQRAAARPLDAASGDRADPTATLLPRGMTNGSSCQVDAVESSQPTPDKASSRVTAPGSAPLWAVPIDLVTARKHPTDQAQDRALAPAVGAAAALDCAHALDELPDHSE